jgi:hypothetical protein
VRSAYLLALGVALLFPLASVVHQHAGELRASVSDVDPHTSVPDPQFARTASLGYNEVLADLAWAKTLVYYGDGLVHHTGIPDVEKLIDLINTLDPTFRRPYEWGARATVFRQQIATQDEYRASVAILRRAVAQFPQDAELNWMLGFSLFYDLRPDDPDERAKLQEEGAWTMERAMHMPGASPRYPLDLVAMRTHMGQTERALRDLREMILNTQDDKARTELLARYEALRGQRADDLEQAAVRFDDAWRHTLPFAPASLYVLIGPKMRSGIDLKDMAQPIVFQSDEGN